MGEAWKLFRTNTCRPRQAELSRAGVTHPGQFGARRIRDRPPDLEVSVCRPQIDLPPVTRPSSARPRTAPTCRTPRQRGSFAAFKSGGVWCPFRCVTRLGDPGPRLLRVTSSGFLVGWHMCFRRLPQRLLNIWQLKTTEMCSLTVPEARDLRSQCQQGPAPPAGSRGESPGPF